MSITRVSDLFPISVAVIYDGAELRLEVAGRLESVCKIMRKYCEGAGTVGPRVKKGAGRRTRTISSKQKQKAIRSHRIHSRTSIETQPKDYPKSKEPQKTKTYRLCQNPYFSTKNGGERS